MSTRRNKKSPKNQTLLFEVYGIVVVSFSLLLFISVHYSSAGIVGNFLGSAIKGLCGFGAYIMPFLMAMLGIGLIAKQDKIKFRLKFYAIGALMILFLILIEINISNSLIDITLFERIKIAYLNGTKGLGGGIFGEALTYPIVKLLGKVGAYLLTGTLMLINLLLLTNASIYKISSNIKNSLLKFFGGLRSLLSKHNRANKRNKTIPHIENTSLNKPAVDKKEYIEDVSKKIKILDFFKSSEVASDGDIKIEGTDLREIKDKSTPTPARSNSELNQDKEGKIQDEISKNVKHLPENYLFPPVELLNNPVISKSAGDKKELINSAKTLEETLESFGVDAKVVQVSRGPVITRYELQPNPGVKVSKIVNLSDDIALNLAAPAVRIEAPIPGKAAVGIEIPNREISPVTLREIIESKDFIEHDSSLACALGKDVAGNCMIADLSKMPHLLIAGATGSGKSVCVNTLITSILYKASPERVRLLMIDPKVVELSTYNGIPHLLIPVVTDTRKAAGALGWAVQEMTNRYKLFADNNVRNIESFNDLMLVKNPESVLPQIVIIIDELADLMMVAPNDVEDAICRLAQMARAAGMHLVIATQRPSVDVLTGVIKANIPSRISFAVSSQVDSRTILDMAGAEKLLGKGDMLYYPVGESKPLRVQGAFVSEKEVEQVVNYVKTQSASEYKEDILDEIDNTGSSDSNEADELLPEAIKVVVETGQASISLLQRRMRVGYNRAARLIDSMEERGIIGGYEGSKPRQVLISKEEYEQLL